MSKKEREIASKPPSIHDAKVIQCSGGKVILTRISMPNGPSICIEYHDIRNSEYKVSFFLTTPEEAQAIAEAIGLLIA